MWRKRSVRSSGNSLDEAARDAVQQYQEHAPIHDIESIVVQQNGEEIVITDPGEIKAFLDQYGRS